MWLDSTKFEEEGNQPSFLSMDFFSSCSLNKCTDIGEDLGVPCVNPNYIGPRRGQVKPCDVKLVKSTSVLTIISTTSILV